METTWEQVDITALGPNSYLWLKNKAKIHIWFIPLVLENKIVGKKQTRASDSVRSAQRHRLAAKQLQPNFSTMQMSYYTEKDQ